MQQWVLSVAGIALLTVLCDVILPVGQTKKYVKTVIGIVVTLVVVQPLLNFVGQDIPSEQVSVQPQQGYIHYIETLQQEDVQKLQKALKNNGFASPAVSFDVKKRCFEVVFTEKYAQQLYEKARQAVLQAECRFSVTFTWAT